jgi:ribose transport system ATP-binding protein
MNGDSTVIDRDAVDPGRPVAVRMEGISKRFPGVTALDGVDFAFKGGEVTGLAGENGSGKSSLIKVLAGRYQADEGVVYIDGKVAHFPTTYSAMDDGVALVAQEILVHEHLSVSENLHCGALPRSRWKAVDHRRLRAQAAEVLDRYDLDIDPGARLGNLSLRARQMVSILKMALRSPRVLILDEPTSSLGESERASLYRLIDELKAAGTAVVYITHRLREYFDICDSVTVLRDGIVTATERMRDLSEEQLIDLMVGRLVDFSPRRAEEVRSATEVRLRLRGLGVSGKLSDINLDVHDGEVVGVAGQAGSGRSTLAKTIFGLVPYSGDIQFGGCDLPLKGPRSAIDAGIAFVPEDRKEAGLVLSMSVIDNLTITRWQDLSTAGVLSEHGKAEIARNAIDSLRIRAPSVHTIVRNLSGGNQQKIVIGKWAATEPSLLVLDEPTRGIDVGMKNEIYNLIDLFTEQGLGVLVVSSELQELLHICDRILVLYRGTVAGELAAGEATEENITQMAFGHDLAEMAEAGN